MDRQPHTAAREIIVADAIREVVSELRMIDVADYVAYIRMEHYANLSDIVESAAELFFMPGTLRFGHGGDIDLGWSGEPSINLDLQLRPSGATVYFTLSMSALKAGVDIGYIAFEDPSPDPGENTRFLSSTLERARIRKTVSMDM